jgi:hypothetical protein
MIKCYGLCYIQFKDFRIMIWGNLRGIKTLWK